MGYHSEDCASEVQGQGVGGMRRGSGVRFTESRGQQLPLQAGRDRLRQWLNFQERGEIGKGEIGEVEECLENILRVELDRPPSCVSGLGSVIRRPPPPYSFPQMHPALNLPLNPVPPGNCLFLPGISDLYPSKSLTEEHTLIPVPSTHLHSAGEHSRPGLPSHAP